MKQEESREKMKRGYVGMKCVGAADFLLWTSQKLLGVCKKLMAFSRLGWAGGFVYEEMQVSPWATRRCGRQL